MMHRNVKSTAHRYKMLVTDLDGTLLTKDKRVVEIDKLAVQALHELGVHVTIATGRLFSGTGHVALDLEIDDMVACMNGSDLVDPDSGASFFRRVLPVDERTQIRERLRRSTIETTLFGSRAIHYGTSSQRLVDQFRSWSDDFENVGDIFESPIWGLKDEVLAVVGVGPRDEVIAVGEELRALLHGDREVLSIPSLRDDSGFLMIRDRREDKGTALRELASRRSIAEDAVVCVGDWINDLPMLESEALSFAMGGTSHWLGDSADHELEAKRETGGAIAEIARRVWDVDI